MKKAFSRISYRIRKPVILKLDLDDKSLELSLKGYFGCIIGNINSYAAGSNPFDKAKFNDGKLDIILFKGLWEYLAQFILSRISMGWYKLVTKYLKIYQAKSVVLSDFQGEFLQLDGEDISGKFSDSQLKISPDSKVLLLDLRKPPFEIF